MENDNSLSDLVWQDINPLSTLHDVMTVMKPELSVDIDIHQIDGGNAKIF